MGNEAKGTCFFITPIGGADSPQRDRSDTVLDHILRPALVPQLVAEVNRIDHDPESRFIASQIIEQIIEADLLVADITGLNANVFYELGIAHAARKPLITIRAPTADPPPFDIAALRAIDCPLDIAGGRAAIRKIRASAERLLRPGAKIESPVTQALLQFSVSESGDDPMEFVVRAVLELQSEVRSLGYEVKRSGDQVTGHPRSLSRLQDVPPGSLRLMSAIRRLSAQAAEAQRQAVSTYGEASPQVQALGNIQRRLEGHREDLDAGVLSSRDAVAVREELQHLAAVIKEFGGRPDEEDDQSRAQWL